LDNKSPPNNNGLLKELADENKLLKETIENLNDQIEMLKKKPLVKPPKKPEPNQAEKVPEPVVVEPQVVEPQVPNKPEPVIEEEKPKDSPVTVEGSTAAIDDLIKKGATSQPFHNCDILGWTPTINANFVRMCPFGMRMGGKMVIYMKLKGEKTHPYYEKDKTYDLGS